MVRVAAHVGGILREARGFTRAELPLVPTLTIRSHLLLYGKALAKRIDHGGPLSASVIEQIARKLAATLLPLEQPPPSSKTS
jgi:hypothetical protein